MEASYIIAHAPSRRSRRPRSRRLRRRRGKSLFLPGTDLLKLLKAAGTAKPVRQKNGRDKRVAGGKDAIGTDGRSGRPVKTCVVISEPDGAVVTMYPGR